MKVRDAEQLTAKQEDVLRAAVAWLDAVGSDAFAAEAKLASAAYEYRKAAAAALKAAEVES